MESLISSLNWVSILGASIVYFILGALWYSPLMFANFWINLRGLNVDEMDSPNPIIFLYSFLLQTITVISLAIFLNALDIVSASEGAFIGLVVGLGFVFTTAGSTGIFTKLSMPLHFIDNGYHVVGLTLSGFILGWWI